MDKLKLQPEKFDLSKLVDENIKLLSSLHLKEVKTINHIAPETFGFGDMNMVNLVVRNLVLNGIKFTDKTTKQRLTALIRRYAQRAAVNIAAIRVPSHS